MKSNKILIGGLLGGLTSFLLGWIFYGIIFRDAMASPIAGLMKSDAEMVWWSLILSCLFQGLLISYIFGRWANITTAIGGASAGATIGALIILYIDLGILATSNMFTVKTMITDIALATVIMAAIGAVVGWWHGRNSN